MTDAPSEKFDALNPGDFFSVHLDRRLVEVQDGHEPVNEVLTLDCVHYVFSDVLDWHSQRMG